MDDSKFCTGCGREIEPGMQFCPQCGKVVSGSAADDDMKEQQKELLVAMRDSRRLWLMLILGVFAIPAIVAGLITFADTDVIAKTIWSSTEFQQWMTSRGLNYTQADVENYVTYAAALILASGICATISMVLVYLKKMWIVAVITCFAAAIMCFWSVFGMIIGFFVGFMVLNSKDIFDDLPADQIDTDL